MSVVEAAIEAREAEEKERYERALEEMKKNGVRIYENELSYDYLRGFYDGVMERKK